MGSKGMKRRRKNATDNLYGNLYKAQFGKASKNLRLGQAPKASTLNKIPNSLKRLQQLQAVAEMQEKGIDTKRLNLDIQSKSDKDATTHEKQQQAHTEKKNDQVQPKQDDVKSTQNQKSTEKEEKPQKKSKKFKFDGGSAAKVSAKRIKQKDRLKQKQLEKAEREKAFMPHEKELQIDDVKFGEVMSAPPKINLKRKHWSNKDRCTQLFKEQMSKAQQNLQQEKEKLRWKAVDAYRGLRLKGKEPQKATMQSLKKLVQKTEEMQQQLVEQIKYNQ
eukprot:TRINITY_DN13440_c0_g3_i1.p1 TRINITY_DN13440_c0_g3~~TRINITY_DN13440_c0_g3_i1.p1  ORF type:complete len:320 (+),score=42.56 TRINITY_DN13440_c0_g3_i1:137-961(+)